MPTLLAPTDLILEGLNEQQIQAVNHVYGPLLVAAGAGAGKTGVLTRRIAKLLVDVNVDPRSMLVSTFTKKAAEEMRERLTALLTDLLAVRDHSKVFGDLDEQQQKQIQETVRTDYVSPMMIGTLHSCFGRMLRQDIEAYVDPSGHKWTKRFKIIDSGDQTKIIRNIVSKELNLDIQIWNPKSIQSSISRLKNGNIFPDDMIIPEGAEGRSKRVVREAYVLYRKALADENSLDFDDILMLTARLLRQNQGIRRYWHSRFRHLLVDEYQDTNTAQFDVLRMIATGKDKHDKDTDWSDRSFFVVGDVDQAIYSFRGADYQIMLDFQKDFGDEIMTKESKTMILLEKNYRSTSTIIHAANHVIQHNQFRVDKILEPTRQKGDPIILRKYRNESQEASKITEQIQTLVNEEGVKYSDIAVLYRNNSISYPFESEFVRCSIPHVVLKGVRFFERKEIKDLMSYLQFIDDQTSDSDLIRILGVPKRGIGATSIEKLKTYAYANDMTLWDLFQSPEQVKIALDRTNKGIAEFTKMIKEIIELSTEKSVSELLRVIVDTINYNKHLSDSSNNTDEAFERQSNVTELFAAIDHHIMNTGDPTISGFLEAAALQLEAGQKASERDSVTLMTIHASKGLEYPIVFIAGVEDDIIPSYRALASGDREALEEERRLFYVAMTRAKNKLYLSAVAARPTGYGEVRPKDPSMFLDEIPEEYLLEV